MRSSNAGARHELPEKVDSVMAQLIEMRLILAGRDLPTAIGSALVADYPDHCSAVGSGAAVLDGHDVGGDGATSRQAQRIGSAVKISPDWLLMKANPHGSAVSLIIDHVPFSETSSASFSLRYGRSPAAHRNTFS